jgi:hypothetical protein
MVFKYYVSWVDLFISVLTIGLQIQAKVCCNYQLQKPQDL